MSLIELPSNTGKVFAVNPHHVTAVQPYSSTLAGRVGMHDMSAVWVRRDQGTNIFVCAWTPEQVLDALSTGRDVEGDAFAAGFRACDAVIARGEVPMPAHMTDAFARYVGKVSADV